MFSRVQTVRSGELSKNCVKKEENPCDSDPQAEKTGDAGDGFVKT
jgi:hypothetical protein